MPDLDSVRTSLERVAIFLTRSERLCSMPHCVPTAFSAYAE